MPFQPAGSATTLLTPADFLARRDVRPVGQLVRDDGSAADSTALLTDPVLLAILKGASGRFESAVSIGARYAAADIAAMMAQDGNAAAFIKDTIADLAAHRLCSRRWKTNQDTLVPYQSAEQVLLQLSQGQAVLPFAEVAAASVPSSTFYNEGDLQTLDLVSRNNNFFLGVRNSYKGR